VAKSFSQPTLEGLSHSFDVTATTLYDAAVLAVAEFRRLGQVHRSRLRNVLAGGKER
jgi:hypothetical protein